MPSPLITDAQRNELVEFKCGSEDELDCLDPGIPLPLALVVARHDDCTLLVFNRWRKLWELPGGMIDPGETPRQAAIREFVEETGQPAPEVEYSGVATFRLMPDRRFEYAAVYVASLSGTTPFVANSEVEQIAWWDGREMPNLAVLDIGICRLLGGPS
ncbi:NUDIX hydrolase [Promicromonospora sp. NPDC023805]|uniref:NUDIX hydrolase n=1 Tax=Promicromonospora sp. NPDC023805 TaxID=3154696 RepID=UPI0034073ECB